MPPIRDEAVPIRRWDYSETSQTVALFCREHGIVRGLAKGSKRERGRFSGGIELLTRGEVLAILKTGQELATLTEWDLLEIFPALSRSLRAHQAGLYFADLIQNLLTEADPHPALYDRLVAALRRLMGFEAPGGNAPLERVVLDFQWAILTETGYRPVLDVAGGEAAGAKIATGAVASVDGDDAGRPQGAAAHDGEANVSSSPSGALAFSARAGGIVADTGTPDRWRVRPETVALLRRLAATGECGPPGEGQWAEETKSVERANRLLAAYLRAILDRELPTMRRLFGALNV